jgi:hypothetical protein
LLQHFSTAAADVDRASELQKTLGHRTAQPGAASTDQNPLVSEQPGFEHDLLQSRDGIRLLARKGLESVLRLLHYTFVLL